jgi:hypothetical protein
LHRQDEIRRIIVCRIKPVIAVLFLVPFFASCSGCSALFDVAPRIEAELEALRDITETDIIGTWIAEYDRPSGMSLAITDEILSFRDDGTYQQEYKAGAKTVHVSPWKSWYLDDKKVIHLERGHWPQLGASNNARFLDGQFIVHTEVRGTPVVLDGSEVLILVRPYSHSEPLVLEHVPTGDPDSPYLVRFHRVEP